MRECKFGSHCNRIGCNFIHSTRGEQKNDVVGSDIRIVDLRFTKVCYNLENCNYRNCTFAHSSRQLQVIKSCNRCIKINNECPFIHVNKKYPKVNSENEIKRVFELKRNEIVFDRFVLPFIPCIFVELRFLSSDVEGIIVEYLKMSGKSGKHLKG